MPNKKSESTISQLKNVKVKASQIIFEKAALKLIQSYASPIEFLMFLTEALSWIHEYEVKVKGVAGGEHKDVHFNIMLVIQKIVQPWLKGSENIKAYDTVKE